MQAFLKPEGAQLHLLLRVPMSALRDVDHARGAKGEMNLAEVEAPLRNAARLWITGAVMVFEDDARLPEPVVAEVRVSLPSDRSFASYEAALAHVLGPGLPEDTQLLWNQGLLDLWLQYDIRSDRARFSLRPDFSRFGGRVSTVLRFLPPGGAIRAFELSGDPGLVRLDPRWHQAALQFVRLGFFHILEGVDHLLFLLCLLIPFRRVLDLVVAVTAFTVAHSITLLAAAFGLAPTALWFPPLVEALIAASIVYMALENIVAPALGRRWLITFAFGLVHGFGFSFALQETLQFAGTHLLTSLLGFNVGVELGQLLVLLVVVPTLRLLFRWSGHERPLAIVLSALAAHSGWHWLALRVDVLRQYPWPALGPAEGVAIVRGLMIAVALGGALWLGRRASTRKPAGSGQGQ